MEIIPVAITSAKYPEIDQLPLVKTEVAWVGLRITH